MTPPAAPHLAEVYVDYVGEAIVVELRAQLAVAAAHDEEAAAVRGRSACSHCRPEQGPQLSPVTIPLKGLGTTLRVCVRVSVLCIRSWCRGDGASTKREADRTSTKKVSQYCCFANSDALLVGSATLMGPGVVATGRAALSVLTS